MQGSLSVSFALAVYAVTVRVIVIVSLSHTTTFNSHISVERIDSAIRSTGLSAGRYVCACLARMDITKINTITTNHNISTNHNTGIIISDIFVVICSGVRGLRGDRGYRRLE